MSSPSSPISRERLATPVREFMRPGVIAISEDASLLEAERALVCHGVHAILVVGASRRPVGWVSDSGPLSGLGHDLTAIQASHAITERTRYCEPGRTAREALEALAARRDHLVVGPIPGGAPHCVAAIDLVDLVTRP